MSLQDFLNKNTDVAEQVIEVIVGDRFKDENGEDYSFQIKPMTTKQLQKYKKECSKGKKGEIDEIELATKVILNHTVVPNFKDNTSLESTGCTTPEQYINKVLLAGEVLRLFDKIVNISGLNTTVEELKEEVKN